MQVIPYHVFVCEQQKPEGVPCCSARGSAAVIERLRAEVARRGLTDKVQVTVCGSFGLCERGPNMVVYPEGTWYSGVQPEDVTEIVESHFKNGHPVERLMNRDADAVRAEIALNRSRMVNALREKDASGALPDPLLQTIRGFQESRVILTAIELDVFTAIGEGADSAQVALALGIDGRATEVLLNALVAMGLLTKDDEIFGNTPVTARYLAAGGQNDSRAAMMHTAHLWKTWSHLTESVRAGTAVTANDTPVRGDEWTDPFIAAMHKNATERAPAIVRAVAANGAKRMLDIGGGSGAYAIAFAKAIPTLQVDLLDVASVIPIAERHISAAGLQDRIHIRVGDLRTDRLGENYDLILLSAICHMLDPDENVDLFRRCFAAASANGRLIVQDFIMDETKTSPKAGALFALNMLVGTRAGSTYSEREYEHWMHTAGFDTATRVRLPGPTGLMIGARN